MHKLMADMRRRYATERWPASREALSDEERAQAAKILEEFIAFVDAELAAASLHIADYDLAHVSRAVAPSLTIAVTPGGGRHPLPASGVIPIK